jgi:acyl-CoA dehydrogenase
VTLRDCFVPDEDVLGEVGRGFQSAQVRLAPARLTHCMRWLGAARRAHDIALERAVRRELFGSPLAELGMAQALIAENEIDLDAARAVVWRASWAIAEGSRSSEESSRAKVFASEAVCRVVDRAVQLAGGMGTSEELVLGRIYKDIRSFRIYDGATEVHKMSIASKAARRAAERVAQRDAEAQRDAQAPR